MNKQLTDWCQASLGLILSVGALTGVAGADQRPDPVDQNAAHPAVEYQSVFTEFHTHEEQPPVTWRQVNEEVAGVSGATGHAGHGGASTNSAPGQLGPSGAEHAGHGGMAMRKENNSAIGQGVSDTRAIVQSINRTDNKVKLKHGPIAKLGMPGMTMIFRVQDPKLLDQVKEGDEVGVTVEKTGGAYVVTGIQK